MQRILHPKQLSRLLEHLLNSTTRIDKATYLALFAYRIQLDAQLLSYTATPTFAVGHNDGGEHGADLRPKRLLKLIDAYDCAVVVTSIVRWYTSRTCAVEMHFHCG